MIDIDALLKAYKSIADDHLAGLPIIDAAVYSKTGKIDDLAGHVYIGCIGKWLFEKKGLVQTAISHRVPEANWRSSAALPPGQFSRSILGGKLFTAEIDTTYQAFITTYARDSGAYSADYVETNVIAKSKADMFDVADELLTYSETALAIERRYQSFVSGVHDWSATHSSYQEIKLTENERTPSGWKIAFTKVTQKDSLPEKVRRDNLNTFWALVDYAPEIADREIVTHLLKTFDSTADSSIQQSVTNSLASMPFEIVMPEVLALAPWLEKNGWLPEILGSWKGDLTDQQIEMLGGILASASAEQRNCIFRASRLPDYERSNWAIAIQNM
jgi:hypothetical protein